MATLTAQVLVGRAHPNHGGINPTHYLFLSENDRPAWVLVPENVFGKSPTNAEGITWIPTTEHMLEDALLMRAIHVLRDEEIVKLADGYFLNRDRKRVELYDDILESHLGELRDKSRALRVDHKVVLTVLKESRSLSQLSVLERYKMDLEVCTPTYSRLYSRWSDSTNIEGSLT